MMRFRSLVAVASAVCTGVVVPSLGQDWTRFRGPNGTGYSEATSVPTRWTENDWNWRAELPGGGHSSPVVWGERVFVTSADDETAARMLSAIDVKSGRVLWTRRHQTSLHNLHRFSSFANSTPAVDEKSVYVNWATSNRYVVIARNHQGDELWRRELGRFEGRHGFGNSPIVYEDLLILANDHLQGGFLAALDRTTGEIRWKISRRETKASYSTPALLSRDGLPPELVFASTPHGFTGVDPRTGKVNWQLDSLFDKRVVSSPVIANGLVFGSCGSGGGGNYVVAVKPGSASPARPAKLAYTIRQAAPYVPTPVAKDDLLFLWSDNGIASCIRASSGEVVWRERVGGRYFGSPIRVRDRLYCLSTDAEAVVLSAMPEFKLLARNPIGEFSHSTPAVADGRMYIRTFTHLISIGGKK